MSNMDSFPQDSSMQNQAVEAMQREHLIRLLDSGIIGKITEDLQSRPGNRPVGSETRPVVLSSSFEGVKQLFIGFQLSEGAHTRSKLAHIGNVDLSTGIYLPNMDKGYGEQDCILVDELAKQAEYLRDTIAPSYNTELGTIS